MAPLASSRGGQARPVESSLKSPWMLPYRATVQYAYPSARPRFGRGMGHPRIRGLPLATGLQAPQATPSRQLSYQQLQQDDTIERFRQSYICSSKCDFKCELYTFKETSILVFKITYMRCSMEASMGITDDAECA